MKNHKLQKAAQRKLAIEAGAYDGRFSIKVIPNKKAISKRLEARKRVSISEY